MRGGGACVVVPVVLFSRTEASLSIATPRVYLVALPILRNNRCPESVGWVFFSHPSILPWSIGYYSSRRGMERAYTGPPVDDEEKKAGLLKKGMWFRLSVLRQLNEDAYQSVFTLNVETPPQTGRWGLFPVDISMLTERKTKRNHPRPQRKSPVFCGAQHRATPPGVVSVLAF
jgi:hypothetical protein